jgi:hypothetical protein
MPASYRGLIPMPTRFSALAGGLLLGLPLILSVSFAQEQLPWQRGGDPRYQRDDAYRPGESGQRYEAPDSRNDAYAPPRTSAPPPNDAYAPRSASPQPPDGAYRPPQYGQGYDRGYDTQRNDAYPPRPGYAERPYQPAPGQPYSQPSAQGYGQPYSAPPRSYGQPYTPPPGSYDDPPVERRYGATDYGRPYDQGPRPHDAPPDGSYSSREILDTGHSFFGSVSKGLASVVEYAFQRQGRPNGYILGQEASGAFVAGLRYGEGILYTKDAGTRRVYWQGPSIGYDAGAEGSKVMMLVYNLYDPEEVYQRFAGVDGSAYFIGGVGVTFQKSGHIVVAPIRSGVGLRLGANVGYLKYTRRPTWNPF